MKAYRILYWAAMTCALAFGLYSGSRFSWMLFLTLAFMLLAALILNIWTACSFSYIQKLSSPEGEKGSAVGLHIGIYNDKPFPFTRMKVTVEVPDPAETRVLAIDLPPRDSCVFDLRLSLPRRGEYMVGMTWLSLQDVFGLLPMRFDLRRLPYYRQRPLLVLPRMQEFTLPAGGMGQASGGQSGLGEGQEEFAYPRQWRAGDSLSRIHWAVTAKTRSLFVRRYEDPAGGSCLIYLDCRSISDDLSDRLTECAATLARTHLGRGDSVRMFAGSPQVLQPERAFTPAQLPALRQWLALLKFDQNGGSKLLTECLTAEPYSRIYILGGDFDPGAAQTLDSLGVPWYHWAAGDLPEDNLPEFLFKHLVEEP